MAAGGLALGASAARAASPEQPDPLITEIQDAARYLGDGVVARPYGNPSKFEKHVIRRDVEWLTASRESSVSFTPLHDLDGTITPSGVCFERHHSGIAEVDPGKHRLTDAVVLRIERLRLRADGLHEPAGRKLDEAAHA